MLSEIINWNTAFIVVVSALVIHAGTKVINRAFEKNEKNDKKKNSLF